MPPPRRDIAMIQLTSVQLLFALNPVSAKWAFLGFSPLMVLLARVLLGGVLILFIARWALGAWAFLRWTRRQHLMLIFLALLGVVGNQGLFLMGVSRTSAINASLIMSIIPALSLIIAVMMGRETFSLRKGGAVLLAFGAVALLVLRKGHLSGTGVGDLLLLLNACCYALYLVLAKPLLEKEPPIRVIGGIFFWAFFLVSPLFALSGLNSLVPSAPTMGWLGLGLIVVAGTVMTYSINALALRNVDSSLAAFFTFLQPILGSLMAIFFLGERMVLTHFIALFAVLCALLMRTGWPDRLKWKAIRSV